jgi:hypothetical protein
MDSIKNLLELVANTKVDEKTYVYFDQENGKIQKIGGKIDSSGLSFISIDPKKVEPIMKGEKGLDDYVVEFDISLKKLNLKEIHRPETEDERSILTFKEIPLNQKTRKVDVLVQQDKKNKCWNIKLSDKIKESLKQESVYIRSSLFFSITKKNDPNILYRTISCPIGELLKDENKNGVSFPFEYKTEIDNNQLSVYTSKYFDIYKHEVLE